MGQWGTVTEKVMAFSEHYAFREQLVQSLIRDLVGPLDSDPQEETITDPPLTRYASGILYPRDAQSADPSQDDEASDDLDEATYADPPVAMANVRYPSSGLRSILFFALER